MLLCPCPPSPNSLSNGLLSSAGLVLAGVGMESRLPVWNLAAGESVGWGVALTAEEDAGPGATTALSLGLRGTRRRSPFCGFCNVLTMNDRFTICQANNSRQTSERIIIGTHGRNINVRQPPAATPKHAVSQASVPRLFSPCHAMPNS